MQQKNDELKHYGVKGMRWGVRRATRKLSKAQTREDRDKATAKLHKHREKGSAKIAKLKSENEKLYAKREKQDSRDAAKAARLNQKAARHLSKSGSFIRPRKLKNYNAARAKQLKGQADNITANSEATKAKIAKNEQMIKAMEMEITNIDRTLKKRGKRYVNK